MTDSSSVWGNIDEPGLYYQARKKKKKTTKSMR